MISRKVKLKVCGMKDYENILQVGELLPDYMGFIFYENSPRFVGHHFILPPSLDNRVSRVGVFVNLDATKVIELVGKYKLDFVQLHGDESRAYCSILKHHKIKIIKVFRVDEQFDFANTREFEDLADYFLFDLQRGYCDYYATAFVVLARLNGLPTRFASGFAPGQWDPQDGVWVITEADAHSWPEVYFPQIGWVAFEPTAGRPLLTRMAAPEFRAGPTVAATLSPALPPLPAVEGMWWDWQMLVWLLPLGALGVAVVMGWRWWRQRREDPWLAVLRWGQRRGRPMQADDTVLEYGQAVAGALQSGLGSQADAARVAAREVVALSQAVSDLKYGDVAARTTAAPALLRRWQRLRGYLRMLR
jgi:hypothetical protein